LLINAGVTHPLDSWLDAMAPGGRLMLPITAAMPAMGATLGKGVASSSAAERRASLPCAFSRWSVYSADGVRDPAMNGAIGALMAGPARWQGVNRLRRDARAGGLVLAAPRFV